MTLQKVGAFSIRRFNFGRVLKVSIRRSDLRGQHEMSAKRTIERVQLYRLYELQSQRDAALVTNLPASSRRCGNG